MEEVKTGATPSESAPTADSAPAISVKPIRSTEKEFVVNLPCGLLKQGKDGAESKVLRRVTMRTVRVGDRRLFGDKQAQANIAKTATKLLLAKITAIEGIPTVSESVVRAMIGTDRDYLMYMLRKESVGERPFSEAFECPHCKAKNEVNIEVKEVEDTLKVMTDAQRKEVDGTKCVFSVHLPAYGFAGKFRFTDGALQEHLGARLGDDNENIFDLEMEILSKICVDFNGEGPISVASLADLDMDFLNDLQREIATHAYGYDFTPSARCYSCRQETKVRVNPIGFLFEGRVQKNSKTAPETTTMDD